MARLHNVNELLFYQTGTNPYSQPYNHNLAPADRVPNKYASGADRCAALRWFRDTGKLPIGYSLWSDRDKEDVADRATVDWSVDLDNCPFTGVTARLGDLYVTSLWFVSVGCPAGCELEADDGNTIYLPGDNLGGDGSWWDLTGTLDPQGRWVWDGKGAPRDFKSNTVHKIVACFVEEESE